MSCNNSFNLKIFDFLRKYLAEIASNTLEIKSHLSLNWIHHLYLDYHPYSKAVSFSIKKHFPLSSPVQNLFTFFVLTFSNFFLCVFRFTYIFW